MQITQAVVQIGLDWKDAPDNVKAFMAELGTLKIVLSETNANIILNSEFEKAFHNRPSLLLSQLGPNASSTDTKSMLDLCRDKLEDLLKELAKRKHGHRLGWDKLKGAFLAKATRDSVENLGRQCQILNSMLSIDTAVLAASTYKKVSEAKEEQQQWRQTDSKTLLAIQSSIDQSESWQKSKEDQAILDWLSPIDYTSQQHDFIRRRQPGTGQWLLDAAEYQEWIRVKKKTLFCPGIPGAGKTILAAIVINDLSTRFTNERNVGLAYIYCNFKRQDEQGIDDLLANLLKQLSQGTVSLPDYIKSLYNNHSKKRSRPAKNEILRTLRHAASTFSSVFIIIDALDECQVSNGCRTELLSDLFDLQEKCQTNLFATSRFLPEVDEAFKSSIHLEIRASEQDVQKYLDGHLSLLPKFVRDNPELKNEVKCEIIKAVDGMFLLAQLYFNSLKGKRSPKAIRTALGKLVTGSEAYDYAYKEAMERIEGQLSDEEDLAKQVLYWIICAKRPLTTTELQHALAVEPGETRLDVENLSQVGDMIAACAGLVTADEESKVIRLVHYTTQEYFKRTQHKWFPAGEARITSTCITYLSFHSFDSGSCRSNAELEERLRSNMLYHYAAQNWGHHARVASFLSHEVVNFLHRERNLEASIQVLMSEKQYPGHSRYSETRRMTGLHTTAYFGIEGATIILLDQESLNIQDSYGRTPLS
ncbi:ankyrin repeat protein, partial [Bisporella sp. PMI_857]